MHTFLTRHLSIVVIKYFKLCGYQVVFNKMTMFGIHVLSRYHSKRYVIIIFIIFAVVTTFEIGNLLRNLMKIKVGSYKILCIVADPGLLKIVGWVCLVPCPSRGGGMAWSHVPSGGWEEYAMYTPSTPPEDTPAGRYTSQ